MMNLNTLRAVALAGALALAMPATPSAQPAVVIGGGLVTVQIVDVIDGDVLSDNQVSVNAAVQILAQVCGINVLASDVVGQSCEITRGQRTLLLSILD